MYSSQASAFDFIIVLNPSKDSTLYEVDPGNIGNIANGAGNHLFIGRNRSLALRRALVHFSLDEIPLGAVIVDTRLFFRVTNSRAESINAPVFLFPVLDHWGEGSEFAGSSGGGGEGTGTVATDGTATWSHRFFQVPNGGAQTWVEQGGDYAEGVLLGTTTNPGVGQDFYFASNQLTTVIQAHQANPGTNFGFIVIGDERLPLDFGDSTSFSVSSRENPDNPPTLLVQFSHPDPTPYDLYDIFADGFED